MKTLKVKATTTKQHQTLWAMCVTISGGQPIGGYSKQFVCKFASIQPALLKALTDLGFEYEING